MTVAIVLNANIKFLCEKIVVFQDRWTPMVVVSQDKFYCI